MKKSLAEIVLEILKSKEPTAEIKRYYLFVKRAVAQKVRNYFPDADNNEIETITEDITQEFFLWLLKEDTKKGFTLKKTRLTSGYLYKKINGLIIDYKKKLSVSVLTREGKEIKVSRFESLDKKLDNPKGEGKEQTFEELLKDERAPLEAVNWKITAVGFLKLLEKQLKEEHIKTLCHWIFREKYSADCFLEGLTSSAKYKRVERIKKTLKEIFKNHPLEREEWQAFIELMETYCQKRFGGCV